MSSIGLFQTIEYTNPTLLQTVVNLAESVGFLGGRKIVVKTEAEKQEGHFEKAEQSLFKTILKVSLIFTVIIPFLVLVVKAAVRMTHHIHVIDTALSSNTSTSYQNLSSSFVNQESSLVEVSSNEVKESPVQDLEEFYQKHPGRKGTATPIAVLKDLTKAQKKIVDFINSTMRQHLHAELSDLEVRKVTLSCKEKDNIHHFPDYFSPQKAKLYYQGKKIQNTSGQSIKQAMKKTHLVNLLEHLKTEEHIFSYEFSEDFTSCTIQA